MHECLIQFKNLYEFHQFLLSDFFRAKFPIAPRWKYVPERQNVLICLICILLSQNVNRNQMSSFHHSKKTFDNKLQDYENISFTQSNSFTLLILIVFNTYIMNYNFPVDSRSLLTFLSLYIAQSCHKYTVFYQLNLPYQLYCITLHSLKINSGVIFLKVNKLEKS